MNGDRKAIKFDKKLFLLVMLSLTAITIPLKNNWNSWAIFAFIFAGLIQQPLKESFQKLRQHRYWIIAVVFFFWQVISWFWDKSGTNFFKSIEIFGAFLSMPIIFTIIPRLTRRNIAAICYLFVATTVVVSIVCLIKATILYQETHYPFQFSYHYLSYNVGLNAVFLSNYCLASIVWLLYYNIINKKDSPLRLPVAILLLMCLFFVGMIFLLSSKLVIFLTVAAAVYFITRITGVKNIFRATVISAVVIAATFLIIYNVTYLKFRILSMTFKPYSGQVDDQNGLAARRLMWQSAIELIQQRPVLGFGHFRSKEKLEQKYDEKGFMLGIKEHYNAHNQYLQAMLTTGIIGLILFMSIIWFPLRRGLRDKKLLLIVMVSHYIIQSMVESTLTIQKEVIFFWFFMWLFYFQLSPVNVSEATDAERPLPAA